MAAFWQHCSGALPLSRTHIMGILNVTPDSFSDGGDYFRTDDAVERALQIEAEGASILDIGAQSTRPGHTPVSPEEEWARLAPVLKAVRGRIDIPISIDTYYPVVALRALKAGADILNDVSGSLQNDFTEIARRTGAGLVMMHTGNGGETLLDVRTYFETALRAAEKARLPLSQVCLDPGVGFGKSREVDAQIPAALSRLLEGMPPVAVLVGASRKRVIAACCGDVPAKDRLPGTLAFHTACQLHGARILRVHDVAAAVQAAAVTDALLAAEKEVVSFPPPVL